MAKQFQWKADLNAKSQMSLSYGVEPTDHTGWQTENVGSAATSRTFTYWYRDADDYYLNPSDANSSRVDVRITESWTSSANSLNQLTITLTTRVDEVVRPCAYINGNPVNPPERQPGFGRTIEIKDPTTGVLLRSIYDPNVAICKQLDSGFNVATRTFTLAPGASATRPSLFYHNYVYWTDPQGQTQYSYDDLDVGVTFRNTLPAPTVFTLKYNANGGTGAPGDQTQTNADIDAATFTVSSTQPTRAHYRFLGWAESSSATTPQYVGGNSVSVPKSSPTKTLYAVWQRLYDYTLVYNANGGTGAPGNQTYTGPESSHNFTVASGTPTRTKFRFLGWADSASATTPNYHAGDTVAGVRDGTKTLYAVWQELFTYTLHMDANGGTGAPADLTYTGPETSYTFTIPSTIPTRTRYGFMGWADSSTATTPNYQPGWTVAGVRDGVKTIYAVWNWIHHYRLYYNANGGTGAPETQSKDGTMDSWTFTVSEKTPTRKNWLFVGWSRTKKEGWKFPIDAEVHGGDQITIIGVDGQDEDAVTLYAVWEYTYRPGEMCCNGRWMSCDRDANPVGGKYTTMLGRAHIRRGGEWVEMRTRRNQSGVSHAPNIRRSSAWPTQDLIGQDGFAHDVSY